MVQPVVPVPGAAGIRRSKVTVSSVGTRGVPASEREMFEASGERKLVTSAKVMDRSSSPTTASVPPSLLFSQRSTAESPGAIHTVEVSVPERRVVPGMAGEANPLAEV